MNLRQIGQFIINYFTFTHMEDKTTELYAISLESLGTDASPQNLARPEVACAETVTHLISLVDSSIEWTNKLATFYMRKDMLGGKHFVRVDTPRRGSVVLSATDWNKNGQVVTGHVGIYLGDDHIASNNSSTGIFDINYSLESWKRYFVAHEGLDMLFFDFT